jgi:hypothetical protein
VVKKGENGEVCWKKNSDLLALPASWQAAAMFFLSIYQHAIILHSDASYLQITCGCHTTILRGGSIWAPAGFLFPAPSTDRPSIAACMGSSREEMLI